MAAFASLAACLRAVHHPKVGVGLSAMVVMGPEHSRVYQRAGWSKAQVLEALHGELMMKGSEVARGAGGGRGPPVRPGTWSLSCADYPDSLHLRRGDPGDPGDTGYSDTGKNTFSKALFEPKMFLKSTTYNVRS